MTEQVGGDVNATPNPSGERITSGDQTAAPESCNRHASYPNGKLCPHCRGLADKAWTDAEVANGWRFDEKTNTRAYHCYERYFD